MNEQHILWINAGGTIVSEGYDDPRHPPDYVNPLPLSVSEKLIHTALETIGVAHRVDGFSYLGHKWNYDLQQFNKDSKDISERDIFTLAEIIKNTHHRKILITHGTDWMVLNAEKLKKKLMEFGVTDKTVLFTGAMVPLSMNEKHTSDALANMSYCFNIIDSVETGVHVVGRDAGSQRMQHFDPDITAKDRISSLKDLKLTFEHTTNQLHRIDSPLYGNPRIIGKKNNLTK